MYPHEGWKRFLAKVENKKEVFSFITEQLSNVDFNGRLLISTTLDTVVANQLCDMASPDLYNHAEADTQIMLHLQHGVQQGHTCIFVCTADSDFVTLAAVYQELHQLGVEKLGVGLGTWKYYRAIYQFTKFA